MKKLRNWFLGQANSLRSEYHIGHFSNKIYNTIIWLKAFPYLFKFNKTYALQSVPDGPQHY